MPDTDEGATTEPEVNAEVSAAETTEVEAATAGAETETTAEPAKPAKRAARARKSAESSPAEPASSGRTATATATKTAQPRRPAYDHVYDEDIVGRATARYIRMTPTKVRRVVDLVRGMPATDAQAIIKFDPHSASEPVGKVLDSAVANAANLAHVRNQRLDPEDLVIIEAYVDDGPTLKRFRPRAQGRAYRIRKRSSHITIVVAPAQSDAAMSTGSSRKAH